MPSWHIEVIAAKLAAVREGKIRRLIINQPPKSLNPLKYLSLGGHGWKIGWKILFAYCSGVLTCRWATRKRATARVLTKVFRLYRAVVAVDECEA